MAFIISLTGYNMSGKTISKEEGLIGEAPQPPPPLPPPPPPPPHYTFPRKFKGNFREIS
jgi:hypothetical protein